MAKKEENPLFVGITNGNELRRSILECSRGILESLKEYERFKTIKEEKTKLLHQLRADIKGLSKLINTLRASLPKVKDIGIKKPVVKGEKPRMVRVEMPKKRTEIERLEAELSEIENKLNSLS